MNAKGKEKKDSVDVDAQAIGAAFEDLSDEDAEMVYNY